MKRVAVLAMDREADEQFNILCVRCAFGDSAI